MQTRSTGPGAGYTPRLITEAERQHPGRSGGDVDRQLQRDSVHAGAGWVMQMVAFRAAGGIADTQAPTAPTNLVATAASSRQINLTWTASTDNVGVTGYRVERCQGAGCTTFAQIGTATTAELQRTGLTAATSYSYRVRAKDAAGNLSGYSATASATTLAGAPRDHVQTDQIRGAANAAGDGDGGLYRGAGGGQSECRGDRLERCDLAGDRR